MFAGVVRNPARRVYSVLASQNSGRAIGAHYSFRTASTFYVPTVDQNVAMPVFFPEHAEISTLCVEVSTAQASSLGRMALYRITPTYIPGDLLGETATFGCDTTGVKSVDLGASVSVPHGWYYIVLNVDTASIAVRGLSGATDISSGGPRVLSSYSGAELRRLRTYTFGAFQSDESSEVWSSGTTGSAPLLTATNTSWS